jgi:hypothetical protein
MCTYHVHTQFYPPVQDRKYYANQPEAVYNIGLSDSSDIAHTNSDTKLKRAICYCLCHVLHITIDCNFEITKCMVQNFTIGLFVDRQVISQMPRL